MIKQILTNKARLRRLILALISYCLGLYGPFSSDIDVTGLSLLM